MLVALLLPAPDPETMLSIRIDRAMRRIPPFSWVPRPQFSLPEKTDKTWLKYLTRTMGGLIALAGLAEIAWGLWQVLAR